MTTQTGQQITATHILSNSSRSKGNQTIKFVPLIEYKMGNIFLKTITLKMWWRNYSQSLLLKMKIEHISGSTV